MVALVNSGTTEVDDILAYDDRVESSDLFCLNQVIDLSILIQ